MSLTNLVITDFLNKVDSAQATPGGGSVSALAISQGISLIKMSAHLSITKKKFLNSNHDKQKKYLDNMQRMEDLKMLALHAVDKDTEAFNQVMKAYKYPKETLEDLKKREELIRVATLYATEVPYNFVIVALNSLKIAQEMFPLTTPSTISDFGVGLLMIYSGLKGGILNVKTNMAGFSEVEASEYKSKISLVESEAEQLFNSVYKEVLESLN